MQVSVPCQLLGTSQQALPPPCSRLQVVQRCVRHTSHAGLPLRCRAPTCCSLA